MKNGNLFCKWNGNNSDYNNELVPHLVKARPNMKRLQWMGRGGLTV